MTTQRDSASLVSLAQSLQMLLLDVDGVMTDGGIILFGEDGEAKRFDVQDGMGITLARAAGIKVGIITSRDSEVVKRRARELSIEDVFQGIRQKVDAFPILLQRYNLEASQAAYIGDDIQDMPIMRQVGIPIPKSRLLCAMRSNWADSICRDSVSGKAGWNGCRECLVGELLSNFGAGHA